MISSVTIEKLNTLLKNRTNWGNVTTRASIRESSGIICQVCEYLLEHSGTTENELFFTSDSITVRSTENIIKNVNRALIVLVGVDCSLVNKNGVEGLLVNVN